MRNSVCRNVLSVAAVAALAAGARAEVANLSATADTFIVSTFVNNAGGGQSYINAGRDKQGGIHRALLRFDFSGIPSGSIVTSATFNETVTMIPSFFVSSTFELDAVLAAWGEGTASGNGLGGAASAGDATWNARMHTIATWTNAGGDFAAPLATRLITGTGAHTWTGTALVAAVQGWVNNPASSHGVLLRTQSEGTTPTLVVMGSREGSQAATLTVGYTPPPPPPPPALTNIDVTAAGLLRLAWSNPPASKYDVLYTSTLNGTQVWKLADANLHTNVWVDPPLLAGPVLPDNRHLNYALRELPASPAPLGLRVDVVASNLTAPTAITHAGDGSGRLFITEQLGQIRVVDGGGNLLPEPFLDISTKMTNLAPAFGMTVGINPAFDERGLLGLAFHPDYSANGRFFIFHSSPKTGVNINCESILAEYQVSATNANIADPASEQILLRFDKPEFNHNGGDISFGPDGYLYVPTGDGGGAGDAHPPFGNAQNLSNLLGKILRIDVDGGAPYAVPPDNPYVGVSGVQPEIFAHGLRNPWKVAFDGTNLWVADVGQNLWEEIDLVRKGGNYGWRAIEGHHAFDLSVADTLGLSLPDLDYPIHEYRHGPRGISIIGGFVYRGSAYPALQGRYVFGDFSTSFGAPDGALYYLEESRPGIWERFEFALDPGPRLGRYVRSFGRGEDGALYLGSTLSLGPTGTTGDIRILLPP